MRKILFIAAVLFSFAANAQVPDSLHEKTFSAKEFESIRVKRMGTGKNDDSLVTTKDGKIQKIAPIGCNWPSETDYGTLYEGKNWKDLYDFKKNGSNLVATRSGNYIDLSGGVGSYGDYLSFGEPSLLNDRTDSAVFKITAWGPFAYGTALGIHATSGYPFDAFCYFGTTNTGSSLVYIAESNSTVYATSATAVTYSLNDVISMKREQHDSTVRCVVKNLTVGGADSAVVTYTYAPNLFIRPNVCVGAIAELGGTHQYQYLKSWSNEKRNANLMLLGNSKGWYYPANWRNSLFGILDSAYHTTVVHAGAANTFEEIATAFDEVIRLNPRQLLLSDIVSNTVRYTYSLPALIKSYDSLVSIATNAGITVFHALAPEDTVGTGGTAKANLTAFKNYIAAKYPSTYIDTWTAMGGPTNRLNIAYNYGDSIHWNAAGVRAYANAIIASGKLTVCNIRNGIAPPLSFYNPALDSIRANGSGGGAGVTLSPSTTNAIPKISGSNALTTSQIADDGTNVTVAGATTVNSSLTVTGYSVLATSIGAQSFDGNMSDPSHIFEVRGSVKTIGSNSSLVVNRQDNNGFAIGIYSPAGQLKMVNYGNSNTDWITGDTGGKIGLNGTTSPTAWLHLPASTTSAASLRIPSGTAPTSPNAGDMYYDGTHLYFKPSGTAVDLLAGGGAGLTSFGPPSGTSNANGATYSSGVGTLTYADATNPGIGKLYTTAGTATDGSLTRSAINSIYAPLASPTFTGTPIGPTASVYTNSTQLATTAYVDRAAAYSIGAIGTAGNAGTMPQIHSNIWLIDPTTAIGATSITTPASPAIGDMIIITAGGAIASGASVCTAFTLTANSGQTIYGATFPLALLGADGLQFVYDGYGIWRRLKF